jgi:hemerythrin-like domain-containing protein
MLKKVQTTKSASSRSEPRSAQDCFAILKSDHTEIKRLLKHLNDGDGDDSADRDDLLKEIEEKLKTHTAMEEQTIYPAFKKAAQENDQHLYFEAVEEHGLVDTVLPELLDTDRESPEFKARAKVLLDLVKHHIEEEEEEFFPKAKKAIGAKELTAIGERMAEFKSETDDEPEDHERDESADDEGDEDGASSKTRDAW